VYTYVYVHVLCNVRGSPGVRYCDLFSRECDAVNLNSFVVCLTALSLFHLTLLSGLRTNGGASAPPICVSVARTDKFTFSVFRYIWDNEMIGGRVRIDVVSAQQFCRGRPSACISAVPTGRISVKFDIGDFYKTLLRESKFGCNQVKISGTT
jgi:hypothetical protein